ncbi:MAG: Asp-tRNA(Asn)/Glu-tRNA(Gln) amidotransferase subunit GatC [Candidatus Methylacidiphilales bacterium]
MDQEILDVHYIARLARIALSAEESSRFGAQLSDIVSFVKQLEKADLTILNDEVQDTLTPCNHLRDDEPVEGLPHHAVLLNAPASEGEEILMPRIIEA